MNKAKQQVAGAIDWKKLERKYLMGLSRKDAATVMALVILDSKHLASHYCMGILSDKQRAVFTEECMYSFPNFLRTDPAKLPFEHFFDAMVGPTKIFYIHQSERRIDWKNEKQRMKFAAFYVHNMFRKTLDWVLEFRKYGVFNWAHYDTYQLIAKYGFPIMSNVMKNHEE